ncbi:hypothetical protein CDAR_370111 [Caerostris darwini]|uniref:Uncharacterized protein n=1 Tax=Caerostris darwini TaxID=1538125 RepID=A0AAV4N2W4_9ARAC|nr:hypothetical protein CDAR_370111 [Caerostris darwini]
MTIERIVNRKKEMECRKKNYQNFETYRGGGILMRIGGSNFEQKFDLKSISVRGVMNSGREERTYNTSVMPLRKKRAYDTFLLIKSIIDRTDLRLTFDSDLPTYRLRREIDITVSDILILTVTFGKRAELYLYSKDI